MNPCEQIHETVVSDILKGIKTATAATRDFTNSFKKNYYNSGSIARQASNLVVVFPVLVSNSLSIETDMLIAKAIEKKCCSLLQILFSAAQVQEVDNLGEYLAKFHSNLNTKAIDIDYFLDTIDKIADSVPKTESAINMKDIVEAVREDMKNINFYLSEEFNSTAINDYKIAKNIYGESVVMEAGGRRRTMVKADADAQDLLNAGKAYIDTAVNQAWNKKVLSNNNGKSQILDNEIKKANELMPTIMTVNYIMKKDDTIIPQTGIIGVKAKLYPVDSTDITSRLITKNKEKHGLFNLIRATTREISFWKDIALAFDKTKMDAIEVADNSANAKMFKVLERRASKNNRMRNGKDASPITSLVISQNDVEYMKQYNLDMEKTHNARIILEAYNLMDVVIVDETLEIAKFLYDDGSGMYEALTFDALQKESSDNTYKKIINLVGKTNR